MNANALTGSDGIITNFLFKYHTDQKKSSIADANHGEAGAIKANPERAVAIMSCFLQFCKDHLVGFQEIDKYFMMQTKLKLPEVN